MHSECPFCHKRIEGTPINKREVSVLHSVCKVYSSLFIPIPFVGGYVGGKIYEWCSSSDGWYYRCFCSYCHCSWITSNNNRHFKMGGNEHLVTLFYEYTFVIGAIRDDFYILQTFEQGRLKNTVVNKEGDTIKITKYIDGKSEDGTKTFETIKMSVGLYVGEMYLDKPFGWGILFQKDGYMWYGLWREGKKNGLGFLLDFDGTGLKTGYWLNDQFII